MELWTPASGLDRGGDARSDRAALQDLWSAPGAMLVRVGAESELGIEADGRLRCESPAGGFDPRVHFLVGTVAGVPVFTMDAPVAAPAASGRLAGLALDDTWRDVAITAIALVNWHRVAPHCGVCGGPTEVRHGGHARHCAACVRDRFPRTDPAVITAIVDADDRLLLAHNAAWDTNRMSLVAGFVDAGESLEACVRRECREEVGLTLSEVHYVSSQPWPFPRSLMLGFAARAADTSVHVDGVEIDRALFLTRDDYDAMRADGRLVSPPSVSIASALIGLWRSGELPV